MQNAKKQNNIEWSVMSDPKASRDIGGILRELRGWVLLLLLVLMAYQMQAIAFSLHSIGRELYKLDVEISQLDRKFKTMN